MTEKSQGTAEERLKQTAEDLRSWATEIEKGYSTIVARSIRVNALKVEKLADYIQKENMERAKKLREHDDYACYRGGHWDRGKSGWGRTFHCDHGYVYRVNFNRKNGRITSIARLEEPRALEGESK